MSDTVITFSYNATTGDLTIRSEYTGNVLFEGIVKDNSLAPECGECFERVMPDQASVLYDGEICHLHCAAEAEDEADFDNWFINK